MTIHPQLLADCHHLGRTPGGVLLLNRNAALPWFILVPETELEDVLDLAPAQRQEVVEACADISRFIKQDLGYRKVNFAGLGNLVPQMHLHIIGRSTDDPCWPGPVWGRLEAGAEYSESVLKDWRDRLAAGYGLDPA